MYIAAVSSAADTNTHLDGGACTRSIPSPRESLRRESGSYLLAMVFFVSLMTRAAREERSKQSQVSTRCYGDNIGRVRYPAA